MKAATLACLFVALFPVISWYVKRLDDGSDEPLGLLTLGLVGLLAWRDRAARTAGEPAKTWGAVLVLASVVAIPWLPPMLRAGLAVAGVAVFYGLHRRAGLLGLLALSLPVVASLQFYLGYPLRLAAAEGAARLIELGSLVVARRGVQIEIGGQVIGVDPACSGVRMLWHAAVAAMGLAAYHRLPWRATAAVGGLAVVLVIPANIVRATLLVFEETGYWQKSDLLHGGIGLASFAAVLIPLAYLTAKGARPESPAEASVPAGLRAKVLLAMSAVLAPVLAWSAPRATGGGEIGPGPVDFTFDGLTMPLADLPPTAAERAFAESFPGTLSSHRWGGGQVILRRVTKPTRRLHPSRDCLRAAGYDTGEAITVTRPDGSEWARFHASREGLRLRVHERIVSERDGSSWTDVSAWYWSALANPLNGPWRAETVIHGQ